MPRTTLFTVIALPSLLAALFLYGIGSSSSAQEDGPRWTQPELEALSKAIQADIEELRGERFRHDVAVKVADRDTLVEYMKRRTEEDEPPAKLAADERIAKLFGLLAPELDLLAVTYGLIESQVAGFYDPPSSTFYLMEAMPKAIAGPILAHELVHALDDQLFDLDTLMKERSDDSDRLQAFRFLAEGSGTAGGSQWTIAHAKEIDTSGFQAMMDEQQAALVDAPVFLWKPLLGAYMQGAAYLTRADSIMGGQMKAAAKADIEAAFKNPPRSTEQVLHPEKYWDPAQHDEPRAVTFELADLPADWSDQRQDTLGELGLAMLVEPRDTPGLDMANPLSILALEYTSDVAAGWGGDRMILLGNGQASWLRSVSVWDSERDAGEFYGALVGLLPVFEGACEALSDGENAGVELAYGARRDEVVLTLWSGVSRRDRRKLERAVTHTAAAPLAR